MRYLAMTQDPRVAAEYDDDVIPESSELTRGRRGFGIAGALRTKPGKVPLYST